MLFVIYCNARDSNEARPNPTVYLTTNRQTQMKHKNPFFVLATIAVVLKHTAQTFQTNDENYDDGKMIVKLYDNVTNFLFTHKFHLHTQISSSAYFFSN
jgi:Zn-dependent protease